MSAPVRQSPFFGVIPVTAAGFATPEMLRAHVDMPGGLRLDEIVRRALPLMPEREWQHLRVMLVSTKGMAVIDQAQWRVTFPHAGTHVVIRLIPSQDALRTILQILVTVAASAIASPWAGTFLGSLLQAGLTALGGFLINLLIPQRSADKNKEKPAYAVNSWSNQPNPDGPVASVAGQMRYAPQIVTRWTEIAGDLQYERALMSFGHGRLEITDLKIGDKPFSDFDEIDFETREGLEGDAPPTLVTQQVFQDARTAPVLERPLPRDDLGEIIPGGTAVATPVSVFTATDGYRHGFIFSFPQGMSEVSKRGNVLNRAVSIAVRRRLNGIGAWETLPDLIFEGRKTLGFYRQVFFDVPVRGQYEYEWTRLTDESASERIRDQVVISAIQTFRPEAPINYDRPLALLAMRIRLTERLSGAIEAVNAICRRWVPDWDFASGTWIERYTSNPASIFRHALQGPECARPVADAQLDLATLQHWHELCTAKGWAYNRVHDFEASQFDVLSQIAGAGLASPQFNGKAWTVIIDEPQSIVAAHLNPRNSREFRWQLPYLDLPDGIRVRFQDETNGWQEAEALIPWIGHTGSVDLTEEWSFPGKTLYSEIWLLTMRRMMEVEKRRETFTCIQDGDIRSAVRGDLVMAIVERLDDSQRAARVTAVRGNLISLDDDVEMAVAGNYGLRFRKYASPVDGLGISVQREVVFRAGWNGAVLLSGDGDLPAVGEIVHFGRLASDSLALRIKKIERGEKGASQITLTHAAPEIDAELALLTPPAWSPRVGAPIAGGGAVPTAPVVVALVSGVANGLAANAWAIILKPGSGSAALVAQYEIRHRLTGAPSWTGPVAVTAAAAGLAVSSYAAGNSVEIQARAISIDGVPGPYTTTRTIVIGAADAGAAGAFVAASVSDGMGNIPVAFTTGVNTRTVKLYLQHATGGSINRAVDFNREIAVEPSTSYSLVLGDGGTVNLFVNGSFNAAGATTYEAGWSFSTDKAAKTAGVANWVYETSAPANGTVYRTRIKVTRTAGSVQFGLKGSTDVLGTARSATGTYYQALTGIAGLTGIGAKADATFAGSVDDLIAYAQTAACLSQGAKTVWLEPFNDDEIAGPLSAALVATVT